MNSNWGPAALIAFSYIVMASRNAKRFDDLKLWIRTELKRLEDKIDGVRSPITGGGR